MDLSDLRRMTEDEIIEALQEDYKIFRSRNGALRPTYNIKLKDLIDAGKLTPKLSEFMLLNEEKWKESHIEYSLKFTDIPKEFQTTELAAKYIMRDFDYNKTVDSWRRVTLDFISIPEKLKTKGFYEELFKHSSKLFDKIPEKFRTQEMYERAAADGLFESLSDVPKERLTAKICGEYVKQGGRFLFVPKEFMDSKEVIDGLSVSRFGVDSISSIPNELFGNEAFVGALTNAVWNYVADHESDTLKSRMRQKAECIKATRAIHKQMNIYEKNAKAKANFSQKVMGGRQ